MSYAPDPNDQQKAVDGLVLGGLVICTLIVQYGAPALARFIVALGGY